MSTPPPGVAPGPTTPPSPPSSVVFLLPPPPPEHGTPLPAPPTSNSSLLALGVGIGIGGAFVLVCVGIFVIWYKRREKRRRLGSDGLIVYAPPQGPKDGHFRGQQHQWQLPSPSLAMSTISQSSSVDAYTPLPPLFGSSTKSEKPCLQPAPDIDSDFTKTTFTYEELVLATNNFSGSNLLGQGGFGYVHKGVLSDGKVVAVKQLKLGSGQGEREFQAEVETISRVHHKHLVLLIGHCISGTQRLLVYEYVPNNNLEFHLHGKERPPMNWANRMKIALGSAKGLAYLQEDCQPKIIHRDIKSSNILLDENFDAKVADFGLARFYSDTDTHVSTRVMGTFGYLAPEYALTGKLTDKSDVFSFGVVLLELITGRRPIDKSQNYLDDNIIDWARPLLTEALANKDFDDVADPKLQKDYDPIEMARMVACASVCVRHLARRRPPMSQVVRALEGNIPLDELNRGKCPGDSTIYDSHGSSDFDASYDTAQYKEDLRKFQKMALESMEHNRSDCSGPTSEFGPQPSGSSSEGLQIAQVAQQHRGR
ncbi:hypothetical protein ACJIZ3_025480 [Penstemon smallii]|uniref:non-specific serine/threonine protein kinase n=1 Tax=Penstemon smallii TaxID=265156 RepID=A0ABD3TUS0_9LAMI